MGMTRAADKSCVESVELRASAAAWSFRVQDTAVATQMQQGQVAHGTRQRRLKISSDGNEDCGLDYLLSTCWDRIESYVHPCSLYDATILTLHGGSHQHEPRDQEPT